MQTTFPWSSLGISCQTWKWKDMMISQKRLLSMDSHSWKEDVDNSHSIINFDPVAHILGIYFVQEAP